jgi:RNA 3'-terminal phosphate cyclase (ATP)
MAPPFDFLDRAFLPLVGRMGPRVTVELQAYGFYPVGTGRLHVSIEPAPISRLGRLDLPERGEIKRRLAVGIVADLSPGIARRELLAAQAVLGWEASCYRIETVKAHCPGNVITLTVESEHVTEVFTGFGEKGLRAEVVGRDAALEAKAYLDAGAAVGAHLADQLLLPMALAGGGSFRTVAPSSHARTQMALLERLLGAKTTVEDAGGGAFVVEVRGAG